MRIDEALKFFNIKINDKREAKSLIIHSRYIKKDAIFIALDNGINYIDKLRYKPLIILSNRKVDGVIYIENLSEILMEFCIYFYDINSSCPTIIGIMGTNGKSTSAYLLHQLLKKSLLITTVKNIKDSKVSKNTTPNPVELANDIVYAREKGFKYVIMEISSIGIKCNRVKGLKISYILLLNIKSDHLDFHKSLKNYQMTKINYLINSKAQLIVNEDVPYFHYLEKKVDNLKGYKFKKQMIMEKDFQSTLIKIDNNYFRVNLIGDFNASNFFAVFNLLKAMNVKIEDNKYQQIVGLKGRGDLIYTKPNIIIDYAHTPDALKNIMKEVKSLSNGRLIAICGAGGNRDKFKRKKYGRILNKYGDYIILTNDNPRFEDEYQIVRQIKGISKRKFEIILQRSKAIEKGLTLVKNEDTLLIIGKGHEEYQQIKGHNFRYSDYQEVEKWISLH